MKIVVTGSSGGVGRETAARYARSGATVIGIDKVAPAGTVGFEHINCDLASEDCVTRAVDRIMQSVDAVDLLVHAAGVFHPDETAEKSAAQMQELWRVNYVAPCEISERLFPLLLKGTNPLVVFIASTDAIVASGGQRCEIGVTHDARYAASKGALVTAMRALAMRWAIEGVRVNAVCPTIVRSPMTESLLAIAGKEEQLSKHIPLGRICEPADVATAVEALYRLTMTTAHVLPVDGGYLCQ